MGTYPGTEQEFWCERFNSEQRLWESYWEDIMVQAARPSTCHKPTISRDGNQFCASVGPNPMEGVFGYGDTVKEAFEDFDKEWNETKIPT